MGGVAQVARLNIVTRFDGTEHGGCSQYNGSRWIVKI